MITKWRIWYDTGRTFSSEDGKPEAMKGEHDDHIMAYAQAWHVIYDLTGVRIIVKEPPPVERDEREFSNVLEWNGIEDRSENTMDAFTEWLTERLPHATIMGDCSIQPE